MTVLSAPTITNPNIRTLALTLTLTLSVASLSRRPFRPVHDRLGPRLRRIRHLRRGSQQAVRSRDQGRPRRRGLRRAGQYRREWYVNPFNHPRLTVPSSSCHPRGLLLWYTREKERKQKKQCRRASVLHRRATAERSGAERSGAE